MAEFVALNVSKRRNLRAVDTRCFNTVSVAPQLSTPAAVKKNEITPQKGVVLFARFVDFVRVLSAPEICFLMVVITKTNYGALSEVPIPRSDIIQNQAIPSLAIKQIREKLAAMGLIAVTQKRIGRGSEAWLYSLCCSKLNAMLSGKEVRGS